MTLNLANVEALSLAELRGLVVNFTNSNEFQRLEAYYNHSTVFRILGVQRSEAVHSSFLAWLFRDDSHGLGSYPLKKFLEFVALVASQSGEEVVRRFPDDLVNSIIAGGYELRDTYCATEYSVPGGSANARPGRIDILLEATLLLGDQRREIRIVVENKVKAKETEDQTQRYYDWATSNQSVRPGHGQCENVFAYLTPRPAPADGPECGCKHYVQLDYQGLVDQVLDPCHLRPAPDETSWLLEQYIRNLGEPSIGELNQGKGELVMAMGERERGLLQSLWDNHERLLTAVLTAKMESVDTDDETRQAIQTVLNAGSKDRSTYDVAWDGEWVATGVRKTDIAKVCIRIASARGACSAEAFEILLNTRFSGVPLLRREKEIPEQQRKRYRMGPDADIVFDDNTYYASGQWGIGNVPAFVELAERLFPKLKVKNSPA
jgi:hypothetical protein